LPTRVCNDHISKALFDIQTVIIDMRDIMKYSLLTLAQF